ncbi:MAG: hypothetical protein GX564_11065 [Oligosphaeraceae bacterium]|nr:hypothetical protein [Oligosphaeraceae bacterium]
MTASGTEQIIPPEEIAILQSLLQDEDESVASLAMEKLLPSAGLDSFLAAHQDDNDPMLRRRCFQMGYISAYRRDLDGLIGSLKDNSFDLWESVLMLDRLYDSQSSLSYLKSLYQNLATDYSSRKDSLRGLVRFLKERSFITPAQNWSDISNYLIGDVLENRIGSGLMLCILAQQLGGQRGLTVNICLHAGHYCLVDEKFSLVDPMEGWKISSNVSPNLCHLCSKKELILALLFQLYSMAVISWDPFDIFLFQKILACYFDFPENAMPYPVGNFLHPDAPGVDKQ